MQRTPALQLHVQDISQLQYKWIEQAILASSNVVQYGNQNTIVFVLPAALPEIRDFLMNGGSLLPVKAGMKKSSLYMFKQSCLRVWSVLQSILPLVKYGAWLHIDLSQTKCLTTHDNHKSFQLMHVEWLEHDGSMVSASSVSVSLGVSCEYV